MVENMACRLLILGICLLAISVSSAIGKDNDVITIFNGNGKIRIDGGDITFWVARANGEFSEKRIRMKSNNFGAAHITNVEQRSEFFSATWSNGAEFSAQLELEIGKNINILETRITKPLTEDDGYIEMCLDLEDYNWYGGAETYYQAWPIQNQDIAEVAFVPNGQNGGVLDRYFLSSSGYSIYMNETAPVFVSLTASNKSLCFKNEFAEPYRETDGRINDMASYEIFGLDMLSVYQFGFPSYTARPVGIPAEKVFRDPIWSTWALYKQAINQNTVLNFSQQIDDNGFSVSQIEIDDNWETCYGDEAFDTDKFPDPAGMVSTLKSRGHDVTLWVHPFVNLNCQVFAEGDENKYFVTSNGYNTTGITSWWDSPASAIIDVTKPDAADWWFQRLDGLRTNVGITAFKFDAGETHWLPKDAYLDSAEDEQPGIYSTKYAQFANKFGGQVEARVGYRSQDVAIFVRELDRDSRWGLDNGLQSVITSALHMGLMGSPFVLPDYIGGNAYGSDYPDRELFIRWVEVNAFLPVLQFSITPWSYDDEVVQICKDMVALHQQILDVILDAANQATVDGSPIIRPLWWLDPTDSNAQVINDQFLVGSTYLVAPVVTQGATARDIYLPVGNWVDELRGGTIVGPVLLSNYAVALNEIAYFTAA